MNPIIGGSLITAGASLLGSLFGGGEESSPEILETPQYKLQKMFWKPLGSTLLKWLRGDIDPWERQQLLDSIASQMRRSSDNLMKSYGRAGMPGGALAQSLRDVETEGMKSFTGGMGNLVSSRKDKAVSGMTSIMNATQPQPYYPMYSQGTGPGDIMGQLTAAMMQGGSFNKATPTTAMSMPKTSPTQFGQNMNQWANRPWWETMGMKPNVF